MIPVFWTWPWWAWVACGVFLALKVLAAVLSTPAVKGRIGERRVARRLQEGLGREYEILNDIYLPSREGETTQIDHVVASPYGVFVVETKNWTGWIFGDAQGAKWTQAVYRKKSSIQNPIRQNYKHICELSRNLGIDAGYFTGVIAITGDCTFKTKMPDGVVYSRQAAEYIRSFRREMIKPEQVHEIVQAILEWQATIPDAVKAAHVKNLCQRHGKRVSR